MSKKSFHIGCELLKNNQKKINSWGKTTLLCNHSSLSLDYKSSPVFCYDFLGTSLKSILSPQHGFWGTEQDNMLETKNSIFPKLNIPIYSLYHTKREPDEESLDSIDTILVDLQIVGCRVYTFKWTILNCLKAAKKFNKKVVILDRPNPLGGEVIEGRILEPEAHSFVGLLPIPMRHGLSVGEFACFANKNIGADLEILKMESWDTTLLWSHTKRYWPFTSPNLPSFNSVVVYPGMVLFEGTNLSEGRGTTLPFQIVGAPYIKDPEKLIKRVKDYYPDLTNPILKPIFFRPTFNKWSNQVCGGIQLIITDQNSIRSYSLALCVLKSIRDLHNKDFEWKQPPYEYEYNNLPINLIVGNNRVEDAILSKHPNDDYWSYGLKEYTNSVKDFLLYKRDFSR